MAPNDEPVEDREVLRQHKRESISAVALVKRLEEKIAEAERDAVPGDNIDDWVESAKPIWDAQQVAEGAKKTLEEMVNRD